MILKLRGVRTLSDVFAVSVPFRHLVCLGPMQDRTREGLVWTRLFGIFIVSPFHGDCDDTSPVEDEVPGESQYCSSPYIRGLDGKM